MIEDRWLSPAPQPEACLDRTYPSSQKGGTLIVEEVRDLEAHEGRLEDPDGYRPARCPRCGGRCMSTTCGPGVCGPIRPYPRR
jgi:hypothetical protein